MKLASHLDGLVAEGIGIQGLAQGMGIPPTHQLRELLPKWRARVFAALSNWPEYRPYLVQPPATSGGWDAQHLSREVQALEGILKMHRRKYLG